MSLDLTKPVQTRDGLKVEITEVTAGLNPYTVKGRIVGFDDDARWTADGKWVCGSHDTHFFDLVQAPETETTTPATVRVPASQQQIGGDHYKGFAIQPAFFCHQNRIGKLEGDAIAYICRHRLKNGAEDIRKAIHSLQLILEYEYPES